MEIKQLVVGELETNCFLLISENEMGIIDPGGNADKILKEIEKAKVKPKYIINTHDHPDHISANKEIRKETGVEILAQLKDGDKIRIGKSGLRIIHTPGHTKGSICLLGENFVFTGDTLFKDGHGRTDFPGGSLKDMENSLEKLSKLLKPGMIVYPGHGEIFKI